MTIAIHRSMPRTRAPRQRGMVTLVAVLFLIATVIFALSQMLDVSTGGVIDGQRQQDSTAAFFIAESGVDKVHAAVSNALGGSFTNATCTGMPATVGSPYTLGRGTVTVSAVSVPATCDNNGATTCSTCTVTSTGRVGNTARTVSDEIALSSSNGTFCNASAGNCSNTPTVTWQLKLRNGSGVGGVGLFVLAYEQQGNNSATCAAGSNCQLQLQVSSPSNGNGSVGLQGNAVQIPAGNTYPIYQTFSATNRSGVEVGGFFLGTTTPAPAGAGTSAGAASYWDSGDDKNSGHAATLTKTVGTSGNNSNLGGTNDGTANNANNCVAPSTSAQSCTSWCYGGDTLAFSFAANVTAVTDALTSVTFGTNATVGQNIAMTQIAKYPNTLIPGAPAGVDAEIWYASNPNLGGGAGSPLASNVSSWKGRGTGAIGNGWTTAAGSPNETTIVTSGTTGSGTLTVATPLVWPGRLILPGDTITSTTGSGGSAVTITATIGSQGTSTESGGMTTGLGGRGTYAVSNIRSNGTLVTTNNTTFNGASRAWTVNSTILNVSTCSTCFFAQGDAVSMAGLGTGITINNAQSTLSNAYGRVEGAGGFGRYPTSATSIMVPITPNLYVGTPGTTLYMPSGQPQPAVTTPQMRLTVKSGTGAMVPNTRVTAVGTGNAATSTFTVNTAPSSNLDGATICAGTCAFFVPGTNTTFSLGNVAGNANFNYWSGGFTCLKGVDVTPVPVTSTSSIRGRWTEPVQ